MVNFLNALPKTEIEWHRERQRARLHSNIDIHSTARSLATACLESIPFTDHTREIKLQDSLLRFAQNVGSALVGATSSTNISHFLSLIFVATCCIAKHKGYNGVDDAQRELHKATGGSGEQVDQGLINVVSANVVLRFFT